MEQLFKCLDDVVDNESSSAEEKELAVTVRELLSGRQSTN